MWDAVVRRRDARAARRAGRPRGDRPGDGRRARAPRARAAPTISVTALALVRPRPRARRAGDAPADVGRTRRRSRNVAELAAQGRVTLVGPVRGEVASGDDGHRAHGGARGLWSPRRARAAASRGRARSPATWPGARSSSPPGPTLEDLDPVRFLGNRSSGQDGVRRRRAGRGARGADVTLVAGPVSLATPPRGAPGRRAQRARDARGALATRSARTCRAPTRW